MVKIPYSPTQQVGIARESPAYQNIDMRGLADSFGANVAQAGAGFGRALGGALGELGAVYEQRQEQASKFDAERRFQELNGELDRQWLEVRRGAPSNGEGLPEKMSQTFGNLADKTFLAQLPPELRQRYAPRVEALRQNYALKSISEKFKMQDTFSATTLHDRLQEEIKGVSADPNSTDARMATLGELVRNSTLPAEVKETFAKQAVEALRIARARRDAQDNPEIVAGATGGIKAALGQRESSNNPKIVNQLGYAGKYQFGAPRLVTMGVYTPGAEENLEGWSKSGRGAPGKWTGTFNIPGFPDVRTLQDFLNNPQAQEKAYEIHDRLMGQEIDRMGFRQYIGQTVRGIPITEEGLKAGLHLGGPGGVAKFFEGKDSADANGTKVANYIRMGAGVKDAPARYAGVPLDKLERALTDGVNEKARDEAAANAQRQAYNKQQFDSLMLAIDRGLAGRTEIEAGRQQGWLDDSGTLRAENALDALNKKTETLRAGQANLQNSEFGWNPFDSEHKKQVNAVSDSFKELPPEQRLRTDLELFQRTNIMPDKLVAELNNAIGSTNPQQMERGVQVLTNIVNGSRSQNPFAGANNATDLYNTAYEAERLMTDQGMTSAQAAAELAKRNDPEYRARMQKGDKEVAEFKKELTDDKVSSRILSDFATRTLGIRTGGATSLGLGDQQQKHVVSIFTELATRNYAQFGDKKQALNFASRTMQQMFSVDPGGRLVQYGPDKAQGYPEINGSRRWVYEQAADVATQHAGVKVDPKNVVLTVIPGKTRESFTQGQPVRYGIKYFTTDENGFPKIDVILRPGSLEPRVFYADPSKVETKPAQPLGQQIGDKIKGVLGIPQQRMITGGEF